MAILIGMMTGLLSGFIASFGFWYFTSHHLAPNILFSEKINKAAAKTGYYYQFKFMNGKKKHSALNVQIRAVIYYPGLAREGITNLYDIPLDIKGAVELEPSSSANMFSRQVTLKILDDNFLKIFHRELFPESIRLLAREKKISLEKMLTFSDSAYIQIYITATDSFSNATKIFKCRYVVNDIAQGRFNIGSLEVV